jgi:AraC-like DNA-binding protein
LAPVTSAVVPLICMRSTLWAGRALLDASSARFLVPDAHVRDDGRMDPLTDVLAVARVRGAVAAALRAGDDWGLALEQMPGAAFHAVTAGVAWLRMPGQEPRRLLPGDVVLLPTGAPHAIASTPRGPLEPFDHQAARAARDRGEELRLGDGDPVTHILCANYRQDTEVAVRLLQLLPAAVHVPASPDGGAVEATLRMIATEIAGHRAGAAVVLDRLVDVLLVHVLRAWLERTAEGPASWLTALRDPVATAALTLLHADPARAWTVEALASRVGVSRATLARRFPALVGETPQAYLTRWRLDLAAGRLRLTDDPIDTIARGVGYTSEYAFSRAFSRARGLPPGRYRTAHR